MGDSAGVIAQTSDIKEQHTTVGLGKVRDVLVHALLTTQMALAIQIQYLG